jgi:hypothetical protein
VIELSVTRDRLSQGDPKAEYWVTVNNTQYGPHSDIISAVDQAISLLHQFKESPQNAGKS